MDIAQAFQNTIGQPQKHVETLVSNVFIYKDKAYKIYKSNSDFFNKNFNDLSDKENRFLFTTNDFDWNHRLAPEVYTVLRGLVFKDNGFEFVEPSDQSDELVIEMNVVDMSKQLIRLLVDGKITVQDCFEIGSQFGKRLRELPSMTHSKTAYGDFLSRLEDVGPWVNSRKEISTEKTSKFISFLQEYIKTNRDNFDSLEMMGVCVDMHADNAVYSDGVFLPIDTYAPKEAWVHGFKYLNIYRLATDVYGFLGKEGFEEILRGYETSSGEKLPRQHDKFLITYCELINWPYQYMLSEKESWRIEVAKKYEAVLEEIFKS